MYNFIVIDQYNDLEDNVLRMESMRFMVKSGGDKYLAHQENLRSLEGIPTL